MRHVLLAFAAFCVGAALAGSASAATPTACGLLKASDYKAVLGKTVKITSGEGTASCNVFVGANPASASLWIIPNVNHYDTQGLGRLKALINQAPLHGGTIEKHPEFGSIGAVLTVPSTGSVTVYTQKGDVGVTFQGEKGVTKAQVLALAKLAYSRF